MRVTYYGHSCLGVTVAGRHLLFDPFISGNPLAKNVDVDRVPADFILVSHGHDDHIQDAVQIATRTGAVVISNFEISEWLAAKGVRNIVGMNHGGTRAFDFGRVKLVNAIHSSVLPDGAYGGNPAGFVIETAEGSFYFSGDTALTLDMKLIGETSRLMFAALCIGDHFTMGVDDAIHASHYVGADQVLGIHFDTFPPIEVNHAAAMDKFEAAGKTLHLLKPGESLEFPIVKAHHTV